MFSAIKRPLSGGVEKTERLGMSTVYSTTDTLCLGGLFCQFGISPHHMLLLDFLGLPEVGAFLMS